MPRPLKVQGNAPSARRVLEADTNMPAPRHRLADQRAEIGANACDHPWRQAGFQRQMGGKLVGPGRKADASQNMKR